MQGFSEVSVVSEKVMMILRSEMFLSLEERVLRMKGEGWNIESPPRFIVGDKSWHITLSHP